MLYRAHAISSENEEECLLDQLSSSSACVTDRNRIEKRVHYLNWSPCHLMWRCLIWKRHVRTTRCGLSPLWTLVRFSVPIENGLVSLTNECVVKLLLTHFLHRRFLLAICHAIFGRPSAQFSMVFCASVNFFLCAIVLTVPFSASAHTLRLSNIVANSRSHTSSKSNAHT